MAGLFITKEHKEEKLLHYLILHQVNDVPQVEGILLQAEEVPVKEVPLQVNKPKT